MDMVETTPMPKSLLSITLCFLYACSAPPDRGFSSEPVPTHETKPQPPEPGKMQAEIFTIGDMAKALGVPIEFISIANRACHFRAATCKEKLPVDFTWCEPVLAREWCRINDCSRVQPVEYEVVVTCMREITARGCFDLDRPLDCPFAKDAGLTIIPNIWPAGPVENPIPGILRDE